MGPDPFDLDRFLHAQAAGGSYRRAVAELQAGRKISHWMWFVFPQYAGLGRSDIAQLYAITSLAEAQAYARHQVLGARLVECSRALTDLVSTDAELVMGEIDALKLRSSMTLFDFAWPDEPVFAQVLEQFFNGQRDERTERLIALG